MKRRGFLQFAGSTLAALGLSQRRLERQGLCYAKVLAQDTPRKLALLVGVNRYRHSDRFLNLMGCATDVEMQRQLLIHRFGFNPADILTLSDEADLAPTRDAILTAFEEHLINQAKSGDIVVFHFSGHGSRVLDPEPIHDDDLNSTFVPGDVEGDVEHVDDIMGRTLFLLMSALETEQITVVLDSCYSGGGIRGNARIRAADGGNIFKPSDRELQYQEQWLSKLEAKQGLNRNDFLQQRALGVAKGVVVAAAQRDEPAAEVAFDGFEAGAFTYLLTQFLFQQTDSVKSVIARIRSDVRQFSGQLPVLAVQENRDFEAQLLYFTENADQFPSAEAVVTDAGESAIWLGGVHPDAIAAYRRGTTLLPATGGEPLTIVERRGLIATVAAPQGLSANTPLREDARIVPGDAFLAIGVDTSLAAEFAEIQDHLNGLPYTTAVAPDFDGVYGSEIHYILSRMTPAYRQGFENSAQLDSVQLPALNAIGLFSQSLSEWIPDSFAPVDEPLDSTLLKLTPKFRSLLAVRMVKLSLNAQVSNLSIAAKVVFVKTSQPIATAATGRLSPSLPEELRNETILPPPSVPAHEPVQIQVANLEASPLHLGVLGIFPSGTMAVLYPENLDREAPLAPGGTQLFPDPNHQNDLVITVPGFYEVIVLASPNPFNRALKSLDAIAHGDRLPEKVDPREDLSGFNGLFETLDTPRGESQTATHQILPARALAAISLPFEVRVST